MRSGLPTLGFFAALLVFACSVAACSGALNSPPPRVTSDRVPPAMAPMLEAHNAVRAQLGVPPLRWSEGLATYARQWAEHLAAHGCRMVHRRAAGAEVVQLGENLFWASPRRWSDGRVELQPVTAAQPAIDWASERADYDERSHTCALGKVCGHYTQLAWHSTRWVGCGFSICPDLGQIWACNYDPPGNWVGQRPY
jgi:hypothetical protein